MNNTLVTGGAGFIGSHLCDALFAAGHRLTVLDNFDPFYARSLKTANIAPHLTNPAYIFIEQDIRDYAGLMKIKGDYDCVVHLAAKAGVRPSLEDPRQYQEVNLGGTQNLLEFARLRCIPQFVFASSSSVYGVNPNVPWREDDFVLLPISPYAATKVGGELLGHVYSHVYGIRFIALRFFTVYGPRQRPDLAIHKFARLMSSGSPIPLYGDGSSKRDYTYIDDIIAGIRSAMSYGASLYEVINLGNSKPVLLRDLLLHLESGLRSTPQIEHLSEQMGDVPQTYADTTKAQRLLGYRPEVSIEEGISRFVKWFLEQQNFKGRSSR